MARTVLEVVMAADPRSLERGFARAGKASDKLSKDLDKSGKASDDNLAKTRKLAKEYDYLGNTLKLVKPAGMISAFGALATGASAAGAGAVALGAGLAPLSGLAASAGSGMLALQTAMGLVKVSQMGVEASTKGMFDAFEKATPATDAFAKTLKGVVPGLMHLRSVAQGPILGGLSIGVKAATPLLKTLEPAVASTARVLGDLAKYAGRFAAGAGAQLARILATNAKVIANVGGAGLHFASALVTVLDAARPLTLWLSKMVLGFAGYVDMSTKAAARSGKLTSFFEQTAIVLSKVGKIAGGVGQALFNIAKAGGPLGGELLTSLQKNATAFAAFTGSAEGQNKIREFFDRAKAPIYAVANLLRDVVKTFVRLGSASNLAPLLDSLRTDLLPILEQVTMSTTAAFGPAAVAAIVSLAQAFEPLFGSSGPLVLYVQGLTAMSKAVVFLEQNLPGASTALTVFFGALAVSKAANLLAVTTGLKAMAGWMRTVSVVSRASAAGVMTEATANTVANATRAQSVLALGAQRIATVATTVATRALAVTTAAASVTLAAVTGPVGLTVIAVAALTAALVVAYRNSETFRRTVDGAFAAVKSAAEAALPTVRSVLNNIASAAGGLTTAVRGMAKAVTAILHGDFSAAWAGLKSVVSGALSAAVAAVKLFTTPLRSAASLAGKALVSGLKSGVSAASSVVSAIADSVRSRLGDLKDFFVRLGGDIVGAIAAGIRGGAKKVTGAISNAAKSVIPDFVGIGDGIGKKAAAAIPQAGKPSGSLMGANSALMPFARLGAADGLHVTDGIRRAGTRTSSGGISYHSSGEAIDQAGSPAAMLKYFRDAKSRFGTRLAELIYTPGGTGIKNGRPFKYTGSVAADHYDHVHTALDLGTPGVGIGTPITGGRRDFIGDGPGRYGYDDLEALWVKAGGAPAMASKMAAIALAESGGNPSIVNSIGATGLWQIHPGGSQYKDPMTNARTAVMKLRTQGLNAWEAYTGPDGRGDDGPWRRFYKPGHTVSAAGVKASRASANSGPAAARKAASAAMASAVKSSNAAVTKARSVAVAKKNSALAGQKAFDDYNTQAGGDYVTAYEQGMSDRTTKAQNAVSLAALTSGRDDDVSAAAGVATNALVNFRDAIARFGKQSAQASTAQVALTEAVKNFGEAAQEAKRQPFRDAISSQNAALVRAQVETPGDTSDDKRVVDTQLMAAALGYEDAKRRGDQDAITEFGQQVLQLRDAQRGLTEATEQNTSALLDIAVQMKRQSDLAEAQVGIENSQILKALSDYVSGQIGRGVASRGQTAGAGSTVRY